MRQVFQTWLLAGGKPAILILLLGSVAAAQNQPQFAKTEPELLAILRSDAPEGQKALACKFLSVYGSNECIPEVAMLLPNEHI
jgi:hypothetical protein